MKMMKGLPMVIAGAVVIAAAAQTAAVAAVESKTLKARSGARTNAKRDGPRRDRVSEYQSPPAPKAPSTTSMPSIAAGTSVAAPPAALKKKTFVDKIRASIGLEYYGGSITDPLSGYQTDKATGFSQSDTPHELDTRINVGYSLSDNYTLSYNAYFWSHGDSRNATVSDAETFRFRAADSFLQLSVGRFVQRGNFRWNGDFRLYPALGNDRPGRVAYLRTGQNLIYSVTPRLTLASYNTIRYYHNNDSAYAPENDKLGQKVDGRVTLAPTVEYQITDPVGVSLSLNLDFAHTHRNNTIDRTAKYFGPDNGAFLELGSSISMLNRLNLNPYVDMFTDSFNVESMQFGANLNISIL